MNSFNLRFDIFTLLPDLFEPYLQVSILQRARSRGLIEVAVHNIRDWTSDKHHTTDDIPYGGGGGMVMKPEPIFAAVEAILGSPPACPVILLTPQGRPFTQQVAMELAGVIADPTAFAESDVAAPIRPSPLAPLPQAGEGSEIQPRFQVAGEESADLAAPIRPSPPAPLPPAGEGSEAQILFPPAGEGSPLPSPLQGGGAGGEGSRRLALICGRYEGVDERVREHLVTDEISLGDYVITGGELAALIVIDAVARLIPGVLGDPSGALDDSHAAGLLEYPHYTRPPVFRGWPAPEVLLSGNHAVIAGWRREQALLRTRRRRPDLFAKVELSAKDKKFLADHPDD
jgi:tRNA (guanine37-N1)-methyltransferase